MSVSRLVDFQLIHAAIPEAARDGELGMLPLRNTPTAKSQCMEVKGVTGERAAGGDSGHRGCSHRACHHCDTGQLSKPRRWQVAATRESAWVG